MSADVSPRESLGRRLLRVLPYVGVVVSLLILAGPALLDRLAAWRASEHISTLTSTVEALSAEDRSRLLEQAQRYNARLAGLPDASAAGEVLPYEQQLCTDQTTMMAWIDIPGIEVRLPIYHGTGDAELAAGVGHIQSSSLPVGGPSTHCVLTAHSGMRAERMFDDIRLLEPGDVFVLTTLGESLAYQVTQSEVVPPTEQSSLRIVEGEDLCTLVTCTPYGVNSHRLLVHARRCAYEPQQIAAAPPRVTSRNAVVYVALAVVVATILVAVLLRARRQK